MKDDELKIFIVSKLDRLDTRLDSMGETLIRNTVSLEEHVRRTNMLEANMATGDAILAKRIKPIEKAYTAVKVGVAVVVGAGSVAVGAIEIAKALGIF